MKSSEKGMNLDWSKGMWGSQQQFGLIGTKGQWLVHDTHFFPRYSFLLLPPLYHLFVPYLATPLFSCLHCIASSRPLFTTPLAPSCLATPLLSCLHSITSFMSSSFQFIDETHD